MSCFVRMLNSSFFGATTGGEVDGTRRLRVVLHHKDERSTLEGTGRARNFSWLNPLDLSGIGRALEEGNELLGVARHPQEFRARPPVRFQHRVQRKRDGAE